MSRRSRPAVLLLILLFLHLLAVAGNALLPGSPVLETVVAIELVFLAAWLQGRANQ